MTKHPDLFAALAAPLEGERVRKHDGARYVTARTVMNRLDEVLGPEHWNASYEGWSEDAILCRLSITLPDGTVLTKCDVGSYSSMAEKNKQMDAGDDDKGGFSDALKRAAILFGVGRYLYGDGTPRYTLRPDGPPAPTADGRSSMAVAAPAPATNGNGHGKARHEWQGAAKGPHPETPTDGNSNGKPHRDGPPRTGKAMFAWTKDQEQKYEVGILKYLNQWAKLQDFPGRMIDWDGDQVALAYSEACRKLQSIHAGPGEMQEEALSS